MGRRRKLILSVVCVIAAVILPHWIEKYAFDAADAMAEATITPAPTATAKSSPSAKAAEVTVSPTPFSPDQTRTLTVRTEGGVVTMTMADYLRGVVAGEMPAGFSLEALCAQAVCARTYALCQAGKPGADHPEADVCGSSQCCQVWKSDGELREQWGADYALYADKVTAAVKATDGVILLWEDEPALACFHASSAGKTEDASSLWGGDIPYLISVDTPETAEQVPGYVTEVVLTSEELRSLLLAAYPEAQLTGTPDAWVSALTTDASGRVATVTMGGVVLSGAEARQLFSLRSTAFLLAYDGTRFRFSVTGSGHGVGMSQWGAETMARAGSTWQEILTHYYPGTVIGNAEL